MGATPQARPTGTTARSASTRRRGKLAVAGVSVLSTAALAGGMTIDSFDAHDGHPLTKGHAGCGIVRAGVFESDREVLLDLLTNPFDIGGFPCQTPLRSLAIIDRY